MVDLSEKVYWADDIGNRDSPASTSLSGLSTNVIQTGQLRVYGFSVYSSKGTSQFILLFDASALPAEGAVPIEAFPISGKSNVGLYYGDSGRLFHRGIVLCNSSTDTTKTLASADCLFDIQFDWLY